MKSVRPGKEMVSIENQSLNKVLGLINPVGKVAITTQQTAANKSPNLWSHLTQISAGTVVLIFQVENKKFVKVLWEEKIVYVDADHLRLVEIANAFDGKSFAITGELTAPKEYFKKLIELKGGVFKSAVTGNCNYLIVGNPTRSTKSTELKKAMQLGIQIITEQQFFTLIAAGE